MKHLWILMLIMVIKDFAFVYCMPPWVGFVAFHKKRNDLKKVHNTVRIIIMMMVVTVMVMKTVYNFSLL